LSQVEAIAPTILVLTGEDRSVAEVRLDDLVGRGMFAPLADPDVFARAHVSADGYAVEWGDGLDLCADSLWMRAHDQAARHRAAA
jgi:hypothetical protein